MSKRLFKDTIKRIHWLCSRCDLSYDLPPKSFGLEQTILLQYMELPPKEIPLCLTLSEALKYLESFHSDVRAQQKLVRKKDKAFRSQVLDACTRLSMACSYTKRTRLNPPSYRIYDPAEYANVLGPKLSVDEVQNLFKIKHLELSSITPPFKEI